MGNAVEKGPDIKVQHPVLLPTARSSHGQCVMGISPRTIAIAVLVEDRLKLLFEQHRCCGLGNTIYRVRDGGFILPLSFVDYEVWDSRTGLRWPDVATRVRHSASVSASKSMNHRPPSPRRAAMWC